MPCASSDIVAHRNGVLHGAYVDALCLSDYYVSMISKPTTRSRYHSNVCSCISDGRQGPYERCCDVPSSAAASSAVKRVSWVLIRYSHLPACCNRKNTTGCSPRYCAKVQVTANDLHARICTFAIEPQSSVAT